MPAQGYLFVKPLLGADDGFGGFRLDVAPDLGFVPDMTGLYASPHFDDFDRRLPWFLPAANCTASQAGRVIPRFSGLPDGEADQKLESEFRQARRKLALDLPPESKIPTTGNWDYLFITVSHARIQPAFTIPGLASRSTLILSDVRCHSDRQWALASGCTMTSDEFVLSRGSQDKKADTTRQKMLELLTLIAEDADTEQLDAVFRQEAKLAYSLLRLVNSAAIAPRSPITSFIQAINLLGRRQLQRWLQLLVYADPNNGEHPNPLLYRAASRGRLMELLAPQLDDTASVPDLADSAFMVGSFSLLDVLLGMSIPEILKQLPLSTAVREALLHHGGALGKLLGAIQLAEQGELRLADQRLGELGLPVDSHLEAQLKSLAWVCRIRPST